MKNIIKFFFPALYPIFCLIFGVENSQGATVVYSLTNYNMTTASNAVLIQQLTNSIDGNFINIGKPVWLKNGIDGTNGIYTNQLNGGCYSATPQQEVGYEPYQPILFCVPFDDTNTWQLVQLMTNTTDFISNGAGYVSELVAGPGISLFPTNGIGFVEISNTGVLGIIAGSNVSTTTNNGVVTINSAGGGSGGLSTLDAIISVGHPADAPNSRSLTGTTKQVTVTDGGAGGPITLSTPQNIDSTATPAFAGLTLGGKSVNTMAYQPTNGSLQYFTYSIGATNLGATIFPYDPAYFYATFAGDSIPASTGRPSYPYLLRTNFYGFSNAVFFTNQSVAGDTFSGQTNKFWTATFPMLQALGCIPAQGRTNVLLVIHVDHNNMQLGAAQNILDLSNFVSQVHAFGIKVMGVTVLPDASWIGGPNEDERTLINKAIMLGNKAPTIDVTDGADYVGNTNGIQYDMVFDAAKILPNPLDTTYYSTDGTHPMPLGHARLAEAFYKALLYGADKTTGNGFQVGGGFDFKNPYDGTVEMTVGTNGELLPGLRAGNYFTLWSKNENVIQAYANNTLPALEVIGSPLMVNSNPVLRVWSVNASSNVTLAFSANRDGSFTANGGTSTMNAAKLQFNFGSGGMNALQLTNQTSHEQWEIGSDNNSNYDIGLGNGTLNTNVSQLTPGAQLTLTGDVTAKIRIVKTNAVATITTGLEATNATDPTPTLVQYTPSLSVRGKTYITSAAPEAYRWDIYGVGTNSSTNFPRLFFSWGTNNTAEATTVVIDPTGITTSNLYAAGAQFTAGAHTGYVWTDQGAGVGGWAVSGAGSQTPWGANEDAATHALTNLGVLSMTGPFTNTGNFTNTGTIDIPTATPGPFDVPNATTVTNIVNNLTLPSVNFIGATNGQAFGTLAASNISAFGIQVSNAAASSLVGTDAAHNLTNLTVGSGLSLSGGTLSATGGGVQTPWAANENAATFALTNLGFLSMAGPFTNTGSAVITGKITNSALTASTVVLADANKALVSSASGVTDTELGYVHGLTSSAQTQISGKAASSVTITTTSPLTGGGDLTANRTFALAGLSGLGTANQILGMNNAATAYEYKTFSGTTHEVNISYGTGTVTLSLPQDVDTTSSPTFAGGHFTGNVIYDVATASTIAIFNGSKDIVSSASGTTDTELGYVHGVTSAIQTQLGNIASGATSVTSVTSVTIPMGAWYSNNVADGVNITTATPTNTAFGAGDGWYFLHNNATAYTNAIQCRFGMPYDWDQGTVEAGLTCYLAGTNSAGKTNVVWGIRAGSMAVTAGSATNITWGTLVTVTNHVNTNSFTNGFCVTLPITVGGTLAATNQIVWQIQRLGGTAGDTATNALGAVLTDFTLYYKRNSTATFPSSSP